MIEEVNPPELKRRYEEFLRQFGLKVPSRKSSREHLNKVHQEMAESASAEGSAGEFFTNIQVRSGEEKEQGDNEEQQNQTESGYNELLLDICKELVEGLKEMGKPLSMPIFVGEFPTGEFNAQATPADGGALLLVNTGAIDFIWRLAKLQALCLPPLGSKKLGTWPVKQWDDARIVSMFADCILSYIRHRNVAKAGHIPVVGGFRSLTLVNFARDCERFLVAHELGHVVNGDLQLSMVTAYNTPVGRIEFFRKEHTQELEADAFAAHLLLSLVPMDFEPKAGTNETLRFMKALSAASAPQFFFALERILRDAEKEYFGNQLDYTRSSHPSPETRIQALKAKLLELELGRSFFSNVDTTVTWILDFGRLAIKKLSR